MGSFIKAGIQVFNSDHIVMVYPYMIIPYYSSEGNGTQYKLGAAVQLPNGSITNLGVTDGETLYKRLYINGLSQWKVNGVEVHSHTIGGAIKDWIEETGGSNTPIPLENVELTIKEEGHYTLLLEVGLDLPLVVEVILVK